MNKHEQLIRSIAEEMAREDWNDHYTPEPGEPWEPFSDMDDEIKKIWIDPHLSSARIAVKHMAQVAKKAFNQGFELADSEGRAWDISDFLNYESLIPPTEKEVNNE